MPETESATHWKSRPQRSGGRAARLQRRSLPPGPAAPACIIRKIPTYDLTDEAGLERPARHAGWVLQELGIEFWGDDEAIALFRKAGASIKGTRLRFDVGLARSLCATAPSKFQVHARTITIGGEQVVLYRHSGRR